MSCPFCNSEIIAKQTIWETANEWVFYNLSPKTKGQCLVVPKKHVVSLCELNADELTSLIQTVKMVAEKLQTYLHPIGFNYGINEGEQAGQTVSHLHFHIMPRYADDGVGSTHIFRKTAKEKKFMTDEEIKVLAEEFKNIF
jgi:histidine triad (HIT) family protein